MAMGRVTPQAPPQRRYGPPRRTPPGPATVAPGRGAASAGEAPADAAGRFGGLSPVSGASERREEPERRRAIGLRAAAPPAGPGGLGGTRIPAPPAARTGQDPGPVVHLRADLHGLAEATEQAGASLAALADASAALGHALSECDAEAERLSARCVRMAYGAVSALLTLVAWWWRWR